MNSSEIPPEFSLEILCSDGPLLAVNKPAGLLTQGAPRPVPTLEHVVRDYIKREFDKPGNVYLGIPHRLDRPVSGVVVFARNSKAAARLAEQFRDRSVRKIYWALVEGQPPEEQGTLIDSILKVPQESRSQIVPAGTPGAREARLSYRVLGEACGTTMLEIVLGTGRMHQIRLQLAHQGWPILGDRAYGSTREFPLTSVSPPPLEIPKNSLRAVSKLQDSELPMCHLQGPEFDVGKDPTNLRSNAPASTIDGDISRRDEPIALHARSLTLKHPIRYDELTITAPLPAHFGAASFPQDPTQ